MSDHEYDPKQIEPKWQAKWDSDGLYKTTEDASKQKCYVLDMFPYPSGVALHVGHPKGYIATDVYTRFKRMNGFNVLHPMGWDAFGLPAENYALKNKVHPREAVEKNVKTYKEQLSKIGFNYDWDREINTTDPEYYKWTQWIFLQLFKKGLAYESNEPINWCPSCQTGLANEDLEGGKCERCGSSIEKRPMRQWVLAITKYADRMLEDLDLVNWSPYVKDLQRQWIGRSEGLVFKARVKDLPAQAGTDIKLETFSAHYEACFADTFVVIAPDHPLLPKLLEGLDNADDIRSEIVQINVKRLEDKYAGGELEGVFTGRYLVDPLGNGDLPIWVASYALADYGTGIVKCSAHDERDFAFAKKYKIPLKVVLVPKDETERAKVMNLEYCYTDMKNGILLEPLNLSGKTGEELREKIADYLIDKGWAEKTVKYKLRDWIFSRQRYWGEPIPLIHCTPNEDSDKKSCGVVAVNEKDLPVRLPEVAHYEPTGTGESPLANIAEWVNVECPKCGGLGKRETNTMPQWAGSSWYYLRYMDAHNEKSILDKKKEKYWGNVDLYVGIGEHITRHMIYARFWHKFLYDIGVVTTKEPFPNYRKTGLIQGSDGRKMGKRWGNVVNPDDVIERFGADTYRLYTLFLGPFEDTVVWNEEAIIGPRRFIERVWRLGEKVKETKDTNDTNENANSSPSLPDSVISDVASDIEAFKFNTAIPKLMTLTTKLAGQESISRDDYRKLLKLLAPFTPHVTEELWQSTGGVDSIHISAWPTASGNSADAQFVNISVQVDGKPRGSIYLSMDTGQEEAVETAYKSHDVAKWLKSRQVERVIYKPGKVLSIATKDGLSEGGP